MTKENTCKAPAKRTPRKTAAETRKPSAVAAVKCGPPPSEGNPKHGAARYKVPLHLNPPTAQAYMAVGLHDGAGRYGRMNFREHPMKASVLVSALQRHMNLWFEGQAETSDRGVPHLANAIASLAILIDCHVHGTLIDDRNPNGHADLEKEMEYLQTVVARLSRQDEGRVVHDVTMTSVSLVPGVAL